jgi:hypothetical protein
MGILPVSSTGILPVSSMGILPVSSTGILPVSSTGILPVQSGETPLGRRAKMALRLTGKMPVLRVYGSSGISNRGVKMWQSGWPGCLSM